MLSLSKPPKVINPLWIISIFFAFTEIVLGYAVFNTEGKVQGALTCFVIGFPMLVAGAFFALLVFRPEHLYAPTDYENSEFFLKSMANARKARQGLPDLDEEIERRINASLTSDEVVKRLSALTGSKLKEELQDAAIDISSKVRQATSISISLTPIAPELNELVFPVKSLATFSDLTDELYFALEDYVEPYYYGATWILRDKASGKEFKSARMIAGIKPGRPLHDFRTLEEIGIRPGMSLEVIPISK